MKFVGTEGTADEDPHAGQLEALADDQPQHGGAVRAERDTDANLLRSLRHRADSTPYTPIDARNSATSPNIENMTPNNPYCQ